MNTPQKETKIRLKFQSISTSGKYGMKENSIPSRCHPKSIIPCTSIFWSTYAWSKHSLRIRAQTRMQN